jgi:hypothetical protein
VSQSDGPRVGALFRYPVKGLSAQPMSSLELAVDDGVPGDRLFALALPDTEFDEASPVPLHKTRFLMLQRDAELARVRTGYEPTTGLLTIEHEDRRWSADLATAAGRSAVEEFFGTLTGLLTRPTTGTAAGPAARTGPTDSSESRAGSGPAAGGGRGAGWAGRPRLVAAHGGHRFTDAGPSGPALMRAVSVVNLASVRDLAERIGREVDPLRFRANVYLDGVEPWAERDWVGGSLTLGPTGATVLANTPRCAATTVNPRTADRDIKVLKELAYHYGHTDCGCYVQIVTPGIVRPGDPVTLPTP